MSEMRADPTLDPVPPPPEGVPVIPASRPVEIVPSRQAPERPNADRSGSERQVSQGLGTDQLARIEDKAARIEEKFARQESTAQRVLDKLELATSRMGEVALQSEVAALRGEMATIVRRTRRLPGTAALFTASVVTALLTAVIVIALVRYVPGLLAR